jgi:hypothetical protein
MDLFLSRQGPVQCKLTRGTTLQTCIRKAFSSDLVSDTDYPYEGLFEFFLSFSRQMPTTTGPFQLFSNSLFTITQSLDVV